jgi:hypothetical protein
MSETIELRQVKAAQNQLVFRSVNQQIKHLGERILDAVSELDFACECDDPACVKMITLPLAEFTEIDRMENRFLVLPGHEDDAVEEVITRHDGYVLVAKLGAGAEYVRNRSDS